jgi:hypothetical protein
VVRLGQAPVRATHLVERGVARQTERSIRIGVGRHRRILRLDQLGRLARAGALGRLSR